LITRTILGEQYRSKSSALCRHMLITPLKTKTTAPQTTIPGIFNSTSQPKITFPMSIYWNVNLHIYMEMYYTPQSPAWETNISPATQ
jgi:hypothetical protein